MTTQINPLVTEKEIVDVIYEAGQMTIKTLICHFRARIGSSKEAQREFMDKVLPVNAHDTWGQSLSKRLVRSIMWYSRGFILQFANEFVGKYNEL